MGKLETSDGARLANDTKKVAAPQGESGFGGDFKAPAREKKLVFATIPSGERFFFGVRFGIMNDERRIERVER
jgi:hypothetical protein